MAFSSRATTTKPVRRGQKRKDRYTEVSHVKQPKLWWKSFVGMCRQCAEEKMKIAICDLHTIHLCPFYFLFFNYPPGL